MKWKIYRMCTKILSLTGDNNQRQQQPIFGALFRRRESVCARERARFRSRRPWNGLQPAQLTPDFKSHFMELILWGR